eukprot:61111_1
MGVMHAQQAPIAPQQDEEVAVQYKQLTKVDRMSHVLVSGYINNFSKEYECIIPYEIFCECLSFYYDRVTQFRYKSDFDRNGIIYAIGSNFGQKQFSNPHSQKLININSYSWNIGSLADILERKQKPFQCCSYPDGHSWFSIDFGAKYKIKATRYSLRHDKSDYNYLRNWNLESSNDGKHWIQLKQHKNDTSLNKPFASKTWCIDCTEAYQMFRIYETGTNSEYEWGLSCTGFEIYGDLINC